MYRIPAIVHKHSFKLIPLQVRDQADLYAGDRGPLGAVHVPDHLAAGVLGLLVPRERRAAPERQVHEALRRRRLHLHHQPHKGELLVGSVAAKESILPIINYYQLSIKTDKTNLMLP